LTTKQANKKQKTEHPAATESSTKNGKKTAPSVNTDVTRVNEHNGKDTKRQNKTVKKSEDAMEVDETHATAIKNTKKHAKAAPSTGHAKNSQPQKRVAAPVSEDTEEQPQETKKKSKNFVVRYSSFFLN